MVSDVLSLEKLWQDIALQGCTNELHVKAPVLFSQKYYSFDKVFPVLCL